ncbi:DegT/DnrJ/EryC1/StrS aminotransferase family protein [Alcanivorax sp.]|uniref:DegT/DnrJ/EryC1/StrS family aminotransferase n=1 Tax=Alcanivorax sp. TaxID=1872427 RepID=UPI0026231A24|nr:DegT/DnrJ/EryC1/StrS family aminotransferase [Alcanivorax sp.]
MKPYLPSREKLDKYLDGIYERAWLTNNGPLVQELTARLEEYLGVENLLLVANGTLALQIAYRALGLSGNEYGEQPEAITTPFTFIATASSLKWDGVQPVFADIDPNTWCIDPENIEPVITARTKAIVPVHVFGNACDVEAIDEIATRHGLKVIYDASHAFDVKYKGESLLKHGDAATLSFHATKLFHTGEGGAIVFKRREDLERAKKMINFGITGPESIEELGINAKMNELQAAMGLAMLSHLNDILEMRSERASWYSASLNSRITRQLSTVDQSNNAYYPILLDSEEKTVLALESLKEHDISCRRYFYPSLESLAFLSEKMRNMTKSENIAKRILCLPIYPELDQKSIQLVSRTISEICHA